MADHFGWGGPFQLMLGCSMGTLVLMALTWNIGAHPHEPAVEQRGFEVEPKQ
jgi:hypothetical protein